MEFFCTAYSIPFPLAQPENIKREMVQWVLRARGGTINRAVMVAGGVPRTNDQLLVERIVDDYNRIVRPTTAMQYDDLDVEFLRASKI